METGRAEVIFPAAIILRAKRDETGIWGRQFEHEDSPCPARRAMKARGRAAAYMAKRKRRN